MDRIEIFCPLCKQEGKMKKLLEVDKNAVGVIYPYCKSHKMNVKVKLVPSAV